MITLLRYLPEIISLVKLILGAIKDAEDQFDKEQKLKKIKDAVNGAINGDTSSIERLTNG